MSELDTRQPLAKRFLERAIDRLRQPAAPPALQGPELDVFPAILDILDKHCRGYGTKPTTRENIAELLDRICDHSLKETIRRQDAEQTVAALQGPRLRALATKQAMENHEHRHVWVPEDDGEDYCLRCDEKRVTSIEHAGEFASCPHSDCELVRLPVRDVHETSMNSAARGENANELPRTYTHGPFCASDCECGLGNGPLPLPALHGLIQEWRAEADELERIGQTDSGCDGDGWEREVELGRKHADELEARLQGAK